MVEIMRKRGVTKGGTWNEELQTTLKEKKAFKRLQKTQSGEDRKCYKEAKKKAKQVVSKAKLAASEELYKSLETRGGTTAPKPKV